MPTLRQAFEQTADAITGDWRNYGLDPKTAAAMTAARKGTTSDRMMGYARRIYAMLAEDAATYPLTYNAVADGTWDEHAYLEESGALKEWPLDSYEVNAIIGMARDHARRKL